MEKRAWESVVVVAVVEVSFKRRSESFGLKRYFIYLLTLSLACLALSF